MQLRQALRLTNSPGDKAFPVWTPDGRIVFNAGRIAGGFRWVLVDPGGSDEIELTQLTMPGATNTIDWLP
jgi:Tol biopolymer transport system component